MFLDLYPDTVIPIEYNNDLLNFEELSGSAALPFTIPYTPTNAQALEFMHRIGSLPDYSRFTGEIYFGNRLIKAGTLVINEFTSQSIECEMYLDKGNFISLVGSTNLRDIVYEEELDIDGGEDILDAKNKTIQSPDDYNYVFFPILDEVFDNEYDLGFNKVSYFLNVWKTADRTFDWSTDGTETGWFWNPHVPFWKLWFVIQQIFENYGYSIDANVFYDDVNLRKLHVIHNTPLDPYDPKVTFAYHLPNMEVLDFLKALKKRFCIDFLVNDKTKSVSIITLKSIFQTESATSLESKVVDNSIYKLNEPGASVQLIVELDSKDSYSADNTDEKITYDKIHETVEFYSELAPADSGSNYLNFFWVTSENKIYQIIYNEAIQLVYNFKSFADFAWGSGTTEIITACSPVNMHDLAGYLNEFYTVPRMDNVRVPLWPLVYIDAEFVNLKLLSYRGLQNIPAVRAAVNLPGGASVNDCYYVSELGLWKKWNGASWVTTTTEADKTYYPFATNNIYKSDAQGMYVDGDTPLALNWYGEYGLYETFWKQYVYWFENHRQIFKMNVYIDPLFIESLTNDKQFFYKGMRFIFTSIRINLTNKGYELAECEIVRIN